MVINICSSGGRSHLLNLAIELENHGHKVRFFSYYPNKLAVKFGLKKESSYSYFILSLPFLLILKLSKHAYWAQFIFHYIFDRITAWISGPCDVFIGHSQMHVYSLNYSKKRNGAIIILERGAHHGLQQIEFLSSNPILKGKSFIPSYFLNRELNGYEHADFISIASETVSQSFTNNNFNINKLFINPYGVNLSQFKPTKLNDVDIYDLIFVGQWSFRKGADLLIKVCEKNNYSLLHVGAIVDLEFPDNPKMKHYESVDERELIKFYEMARAFVIPSREDGYAMVVTQAIACGLPIVVSKFTGAKDLIKILKDPKWIIEMEDFTSESLNKCINRALCLAKEQKGLRSYFEGIEEALSWESYGNRYNKFLLEKCSK
jgi:glycosyltransferase involved in cell wall biosynthesis